MSDGQIFSFGPYQIDIRKEQLWCATQPVRLTPKAFQLLSYVVARPGQLVTKEELFQVVWAETVVSDAALTTCVQEIRKALQDDARNPIYLETVHRRGFRFMGTVVRDQVSGGRSQEVASSQHSVDSRPEQVTNEQEVSSVMPAKAGIQAAQPEAPSESPWIPASAGMTQLSSLDGAFQPDSGPAQRNPGEMPEMEPRISLRSIRATRRMWIGAMILIGMSALVFYLVSFRNPQSTVHNQEALPLPDKPSLIVLPLVNLSGDPEQEYFSDGLTEVLTGDLSKISSLLVIARNSAFTYKGKPTKVQDVSREMGVRYVLEGSVQKANQRIRIAVQLIDAMTGYEVWSEQYDRPLTDIFTLQSEIVQKIVVTLQLQLTLQEQGVLVRKHTNNLEAYDYLLRGLEYFYHFSKEANAQAQQMCKKAIALDPQYAEAYAQLGFTYWFEWALHWSTDPQTLERASAAEQQALALNDLLPVAHMILGMVYVYQQQYEQAIAEEERAVALDPNRAGAYVGQAEVLNTAGRPEEALRALAQVKRLTPHSPPPSYTYDLGWAYRMAGRYAEAITALQEFLSRKPDAMAAHLELAVSYLLQWISQQSPADQTLEPARMEVQRALVLNDSRHVHHLASGIIYLYQRQYEQALAEMERGVALAPDNAFSYAALANVLSCVGRTDDALEAAVQALRLKSLIPDDHLANVGIAYAVAGHYEQARVPLQRYLSRYPNILLAHLMLAGVYSELGREAEARTEAAEVLRLNPKFSLEVHKQRMPIKDPAVLERHIAALRKAGLK